MQVKRGKYLKKVVAMLLMTLLFSNLSVFAASVGDELAEPEPGWERYDDSYSRIIYDGNWIIVPSSSYYNDRIHSTNQDDASVKFNFTGRKLRVIGTLAKNDSYSSQIEVLIDGVQVGNFSQFTDKSVRSALNFEISSLEDKEHTVQLNNVTGKNFLLDAIDLEEGNTLLPYDSSIAVPQPVLTITSEKSTIKVGEEVTAELDIDNIQNIAAEDIKIAYDSEKLQYLGHEELEGIKLVYNDVQNGELRFILASKGESNLITTKTTLLKLKFKGIQVGEALADITKGRVSDGIDMEKDLTAEECDQTIITIEGINDVNNSGEFTLLDLAIDARHLLKDPTLPELSEYNTDVVVNNAIDEEDLLEIGKYMLLNSNYNFNN